MAIPTEPLSAELVAEMVRSIETVSREEHLFGDRLFVSPRVRDQLPAWANESVPADNPILQGYTTSLVGLPVDVVDVPPEEVFDWSGCRSPSRAKRRYARGIPQKVKIERREVAYLVDSRAIAKMMGATFDRMALTSLGVADAEGGSKA